MAAITDTSSFIKSMCVYQLLSPIMVTNKHLCNTTRFYDDDLKQDLTKKYVKVKAYIYVFSSARTEKILVI